MDWSLYRCGRIGHITYAPAEPQLREHMHARTVSGDLWRCLRCGTFVTGEPTATGPATDAPVVRRGVEIRSQLILRVFAIERFLRFLLFGGVAVAIWQFRHSRHTIEQTFNRDLPIVRSTFNQLGFNVNHSRLLVDFRKALHISPHTLTLIAIGVALFAVVELIEGIGLWMTRRWGEYFAMVVTSLGLPYEIYDLSLKISWTKLVLFGINLALVLYLVLTKRLFGARGGKAAYEAKLRAESVFDEAAKEAARARETFAAQAQSAPSEAAAAQAQAAADAEAQAQTQAETAARAEAEAETSST